MVSHLGNEGPHHESVEHLQVAPRFPPVQLAHKLPEAAHRMRTCSQPTEQDREMRTLLSHFRMKALIMGAWSLPWSCVAPPDTFQLLSQPSDCCSIRKALQTALRCTITVRCSEMFIASRRLL